MSHTVSTKRLPTGVAVGYGVGDMASSLAVTTNALFLLKFATDVLHLDAKYAGLALLMGKIFDAITDPIMGEIADRTRHRWGSKRPYLLFGALPFGLSFALLYSMPSFLSSSSQLSIFVMFTVFCSLQSLCFTICNIPYTAMTASLTQDSEDRTRLTMFRFAFSTTATIIVATATLGIVGKFSFQGVGILYGLLMTGSLLVTFFATSELPATTTPAPFSLRKSLSAYVHAWNIREFRILLGVFFFHTIAFALLAAWIVYYAKYSLAMKDEEMVMAPMIVVSLLMLWPWYQISTKIDKKKAYLVGTLWCVPAFLLLLWPAQQHTVQIVAVAVVIGIGFSAYSLFPYAMFPDIVEVDEFENGQRREGMFYGVWVFMEKVGRGTAFLLAGWGLSWIGYTQGAPMPKGIGDSLRWLIALAPLGFLLVGGLFLWIYPLTSERHQAICDELKKRKQGEEG